MSDDNNCHDFVVVDKDVVCLSWILAYFLQTSIKELLDFLHELTSIQKSNCWNKSVTFDQIQQSAICKVQKEIEWNQWEKVINKLSIDISDTDFRNILDLLIGYLISVFQEEFQNAVKQKHGFHHQLKHIKVIDFCLSKHLCINLVWSINPLFCVLINAVSRCCVCTWLFVLLFRETIEINIIPECSKVSICK